MQDTVEYERDDEEEKTIFNCRRPFPEDNTKVLLDLHLTQDIMDPGHIVADLPDELRKFILKSARCDPNQRYQDMD